MQKIPIDLAEKLDCLRRCRYCAGVGEDALAEIAKGMHLYCFEPHEELFCEGEASAGLHIVRKGSVKLFKISPQGRELIIKVFGEGESFNEVPVFDHGQNPVSAAGLEAGEVWVVKPEAIQNALESHPEMAQAVILNLAQNLRMLVSIVEELSFYQVTHRLARLINQAPTESLDGSATHARSGIQGLTQDQIAARLGTVREVVARSLRELERSGAIRVERRRIHVMDRAVLQEWAGNA
jgi:CRP/FNR family transcriptional regulator